MADALISAILQQLAHIIDREVQQELKLVVGVEQAVESLTSLLETIQAVLEDAERRQLKEVTTKNWLTKLKDVAYDMDDLLDEWSTALLTQNATHPLPERKQSVRSFLPSPRFCFSFSFSQVFSRHDIAVKIKQVRDRVDALAKETVFYSFRPTKENDRLSDVVEPGRLSSSFVDASRVRGRDHDKRIIISKLLSESNQESGGVHVISIVGMGGIGKTTLAQVAYNDDDVKVHFKSLRLWVCVSEPFDKVRIAKAILESLNGVSPNLNELQSLLQGISKSVEGKKFLLVLDDVWNEDNREWEPLKLSLKCGAPGSRILVTTRKEAVAKKMESTHLFHLGELPMEECWSLFKQVAFCGRSMDELEEFTEMGRKISNKCKGLPFAAKTLGDLMQLKRTREEWQNVLASELWKLEEVGRGLFPPLLLSYYDLPAAIRQCFLYCSVFPKEYKMEKTELINLWMAHGYLRGSEMEFVGKGYFENLVMHSFFQDFEEIEEIIDFEMRNSATRFKMHDVVHDFVQSLTKNECCRMDIRGLEKPRIGFSYEKARHLYMMLDVEAPFPLSIYKAKNLRSLIVKTNNSSIQGQLPDLFQRLTCLRSLDLSESSIEEIPAEVGKLIHLRYLNLSQNATLKTLPDTVCNLYNLQLLNLTSCRSLQNLPQGIGRLSELRHIQMIGSRISFMPKGFERLHSLRTLSYFIVCIGENETKAANLGELKNLNRLQGNLLIKNLGNVAEPSEALKAELKNKINLHGLFLYFTREETGQQANDDDIIEALQAPSDLEYLRIGAYRGTSLPSWMMLLMKLRDLEIVDSSCEFLPALGQLSSLVKLTMEIRRVKRLDFGFLGIATADTSNKKPKKGEEGMMSVTAFPKLKELTIWYMKDLEKWDGKEKRMGETDNSRIMPQLEYLRILDCPKLKTLPDYILMAPLQHLIISECPILNQRYQKGTGKDSHRISHISHINIY